MEKRKSLASLAALAFLAACECGSDKVVTEDVAVVEDFSLRDATADFVANAGDRAYFDFDKSTLTAEAEATITRQVEWLQKHQDFKVLIEGHCDERGTREYNIGLGERRADAVAKFMTDHGISGDRVRTISYGKDRPIVATGSQEEIYRLNRVGIAVLEKN